MTAPRNISERLLLERDAEIAAVVALLEDVERGQPELLAFEAAAGLGKSQLLIHASRLARDRGHRVLAVRGDEFERAFAWRGVLAVMALLEPEIAAASASAAVALAPLRDDPASATGSPDEIAFAIFEALSDVVRAASDYAPVLLVIDDGHWLDEPTLRFLRYTLGRSLSSRIGVLIALRPDEPDSAAGLLRSLLVHPSARTLAPSPLTPGAVASIIRAETGAGQSDAFCQRCAEVTGGNPFYVHELAAFVAEGGLDAAQMLDRVAPPTIQRSVLLRLSRLGADARSVAQTLAVFGDDVDPYLIGRALHLSTSEVLEHADVLATASLVRITGTLRFAHPLIRTIIESDIPRGSLASAHATAAGVLGEAGAPAERIATHLLEAPVTSVAGATEVLARAASRAVARGAPASAVVYLERALLEPATPESRMALRAQLAAAALASASPRAIMHLENVLGDVSAPEDRARILLMLGWALYASGQPAAAAEAFEEGQRELGGRDHDLASELATGALSAGMIDATRAKSVHARLKAIGELESATSDSELHLHSQLACLALFAGTTPADRLAAFTRPILRDAMLQEDQILTWTRWNAIGVLSWCDCFDDSLRACDELLARGERTGSALIVAMASYARAWPSLWTGRLAQAAEDGRRAIDIWSAGAATCLPAAMYYLVWALIETARPEEAEAALAEIDSDRWEQTAFASFILAARARVAEARGDLDSALDLWLQTGSYTVESMHAPNPTLLPWRSSAAMLAHRLGKRDQTQRLATQNLELARLFAAPRALAEALRVNGSTTPGDEGLAWLHEAVALIAPTGARLEHARALIELGAALRRAGRPAQARIHLRAGASIADEIDAIVLAGRAADELRAAGGRPARRKDPQRGVGSLTDRERRVADLAATGVTNRAIAGELYVTVKAVEWHLKRVYVKLEVSGRSALAAALSDHRH